MIGYGQEAMVQEQQAVLGVQAVVHAGRTGGQAATHVWGRDMPAFTEAADAEEMEQAESDVLE